MYVQEGKKFFVISIVQYKLTTYNYYNFSKIVTMITIIQKTKTIRLYT